MGAPYANLATLSFAAGDMEWSPAARRRLCSRLMSCITRSCIAPAARRALRAAAGAEGNGARFDRRFPGRFRAAENAGNGARR